MTAEDTGEPGRLTRDEVAKVANLALLELSDDELDMFTGQLGAVLDRARELGDLDVEDIPPTAHPYPLVNVFRDDEPELSEGVRAEALAMGPDVEDDRYKVPPALGEEP